MLRLPATGPGDAEPADRLFLGPATVRTRVGRLLSELGLRDRSRRWRRRTGRG